MKIIIVFLLIANTVFCQNIPELKPNQTINCKKEGAWVYWYNAKWKSTNLKDSVAFYRKITFKNDKPIGIVNDFYKSGQKQWEGKLISNEPEINEGKCTWYYENGNKSNEVNFVNGLKEGEEIKYYNNGKIDSKHNYVKGKLEGKTESFYITNGATELIGNYENNEKKGKWIWYFDNGNEELTIRYGDNGKKDGKEVSYYENGNIKSETFFLNGMEEGERKEYYENGNVKKITKYANNKKIGEVKSFNENIIIPDLKPNQTINCKKEGAWIFWYNAKWKPTTLKDSVAYYRKITFKEDKPIGIVNDFYKSGQKQWEGKLISSEPEVNEGICTWFYENGNKSSEVNFVNGLKEGEENSYYESGKIKRKINIVQGKSNGKVTVFYENGNIALIGEYQNDEKSGKWTWYKKDGSIDSEDDYSLPKFNDNKTITIFDKLYNATYEEFKNIIKNEKPNLNEKDVNQATLLMHAVLYKDLEFVKLLIENGANTTNDFNKGMLCLDDKCTSYYGNLTGIAAAENKLAILSFFIEVLKIPIDDKEYNHKTKQYGWDALQWASYNGNIRILQYLIDKGANINIQDADGNTPLLLACINKQKDAAELLISLKADTKISNKENKSFIDYQQNIVLYNYDGNLNHVSFDVNFEMIDKECFDKNDLAKIKELFDNKLINSNERDPNKLINKEILNQINSLFQKNFTLNKWPYLKCLNLDEVPENSFPGLYKGFTIPVEFIEKSYTIVYFILTSRSLSNDSEKQSWFNLLPLMTDDQISKTYNILIRENNKLELIEEKYEEKKYNIKLKYLTKWSKMLYTDNNNHVEKILGETYNTPYNIQFNNSKKTNDIILKYMNRSTNIHDIFKNENITNLNSVINSDLKSILLFNSNRFNYNLNKLYNLLITINQGSINKDKLLLLNDKNYFNKTQQLFSFELNNKKFMQTMKNYASNSSWVTDKNTIFNKNEICANPDKSSVFLFNMRNTKQNEYFLEKTNTKESFIKSNKIRIDKYISLKKEIDSLTLDKLLLNKVSSIKYYTLDDIKTNLSKDEVAIEFMVLKDDKSKSEDYYALIQLPEEDIVKSIKLCSKKDLELIYDAQSMVATYNNNKLYNLIWKPIEEITNNYTTIYYTTDGYLNKINIGLLKKNKDYLFQSKKIFRLTSTSKLIEEKAESSSFNCNKIALFGGIDFENLKNKKRDIGIDFGDFGSIEGTKKEIEWISKNMNSTTNIQMFSNDQANKTNFFNLNEIKPNILHIATHGFFIPKTEVEGTIGLEVIQCAPRYFIIAPTLFEDKSSFEKYSGAEIIEIKDENNNLIDFHSKSSIDFYKKLKGIVGSELFVKVKTADGKEEIVTTKRIISDNYEFINPKSNKYSDAEDPMVRAGLALYGANEKLNDEGIITAHEISRLNLPSTELVVLSACNTAIGDNIDSEGVYGLIRAFKMAGVKNLLITYWSIPDDETVKFMQYFYESIREGNKPRAALNDARNKMIKDGYMISSWGAFDIIR